jgi:F-type H+-transporting ATPase subunit epsilon
MTVEILTPEKKLYTGEARAVQLPGVEGSFQVLDRHAALISALKEGTIKVDDAKGSQKFPIKSGFVEVLNNKVTVLLEGVLQ